MDEKDINKVPKEGADGTDPQQSGFQLVKQEAEKSFEMFEEESESDEDEPEIQRAFSKRTKKISTRKTERKNISFDFQCQGLRSGSHWSIGLPPETKEQSI